MPDSTGGRPVTGSERLLNAVIRLLVRATCRIRGLEELEKIPALGPAILVSNHVSYVEGPLFFVHLRPRKMVAMGKRELWDKPLTRFIMNTWGAIPLRRSSRDVGAVRRAYEVLRSGAFLCMAPEGTRSRDGVLRRGRGGTAYLAAREGVPIIPVAHWGLHLYRRNLRRLRRTTVHIKIGRPFTIHLPGGGKPTREERRQMADEMMYRIALCLPEKFRGPYGDLSSMTRRYIRVPGEDAVPTELAALSGR